MNYILYCRKSTDTEDKQIHSLDSQENELREVAKKNNLNIVKVFKESMSAKESGRPIFNEMMDIIEKGKADGILCWKLDRLARNFIDGGKIIDLLQKSIIKEIRTYTSTHLPNDNVLLLAVNFGMANQYIRDLSENVKRGNRAKLEKGGWPNYAPVGYLNNKADKTIKVDEKRKHHVQKAFNLYATGGYSLGEIKDTLYKDGFKTRRGKKYSKSSIHRMLQNSFYCGLMEKYGKTYKGNHEPLISFSKFEKVKEVLNKGKSRSKKKKHFYSARGFLTCANCGCMLTAVTKKGYIYYYCTNGKGNCEAHKHYLRKEKIDNLLSGVFEKLKFDDEVIEIFGEAYKEKYENKRNETESLIKPLNNELNSLLEKELRLTDGYTSGKIREEIYDLKLEEINNERERTKAKIKEIRENKEKPRATFEQVKKFLLSASKAGEHYRMLEKQEQRQMLENILLNASIKNEKVAYYKLKSPYKEIAQTPKNGDFEIMCPGWDLNPHDLMTTRF